MITAIGIATPISIILYSRFQPTLNASFFPLTSILPLPKHNTSTSKRIQNTMAKKMTKISNNFCFRSIMPWRCQYLGSKSWTSSIVLAVKSLTLLRRSNRQELSFETHWSKALDRVWEEIKPITKPSTDYGMRILLILKSLSSFALSFQQIFRHDFYCLFKRISVTYQFDSLFSLEERARTAFL